MTDNAKLFDKVECSAYYKKVKDGIYLSRDVAGAGLDSEYSAYKWDEELKELDNFCGDSIEKTYYERTDKNFSGVIVGFQNLVITGYIGTDSDYDEYEEHYRCFCFKKPKDTVKVAKVCFRNNGFRYVPLDSIKRWKNDKPMSV